MSDKPFRVLPRLDDTNRHFWTGGEHGELRILRCQRCGYWLHPPGPVCPACLSADLAPEALSGRASVHTYTVNHQPWYPGLDPPYVVATNIVGCEPADVHIGMAVRVTFDRVDDVWLPMFAPVAGTEAAP